MDTRLNDRRSLVMPRIKRDKESPKIVFIKWSDELIDFLNDVNLGNGFALYFAKTKDKMERRVEREVSEKEYKEVVNGFEWMCVDGDKYKDVILDELFNDYDFYNNNYENNLKRYLDD